MVWSNENDQQNNMHNLLKDQGPPSTHERTGNNPNQHTRSPIDEINVEKIINPILDSGIANHNLGDDELNFDQGVNPLKMVESVSSKGKRDKKKKTKQKNRKGVFTPMDLIHVMEDAIKKSKTVDQIYEHLPSYSKHLTLLILKNLDVGCFDTSVDVHFSFDTHDNMLKKNKIELTYFDQVENFYVIIFSLITHVETNISVVELNRRAFALFYQFQQHKILGQWSSIKDVVSEDINALATLLKVEEEWPLFPDYDAHTLKSIQRKLNSLDEIQVNQLKSIFLTPQRTYRLFIIKCVSQAKEKQYRFSMSDLELKHLMKRGYSIALVLQLDLALELSSQVVNWDDLRFDEKEDKLVSVYCAMNGELIDNQVAYKILPVNWLSSPVRDLMLKQSSNSDRFENRMKMLISFSKSHIGVQYKSWKSQDTKEPWSTELLNSAEALAATYSGIQLESLAELKYWHRKKIQAPIFSRLFQKIRNSSENEKHEIMSHVRNLHGNPFHVLKCWPESKQEEKELPVNLLSQRDLFVNYFDLLDIQIND